VDAPCLSKIKVVEESRRPGFRKSIVSAASLKSMLVERRDKNADKVKQGGRCSSYMREKPVEEDFKKAGYALTEGTDCKKKNLSIRLAGRG